MISDSELALLYTLNPIKPGGGGGILCPRTINLFATPRVFVRFSSNLVTFPRILLKII